MTGKKESKCVACDTRSKQEALPTWFPRARRAEWEVSADMLPRIIQREVRVWGSW